MKYRAFMIAAGLALASLPAAHAKREIQAWPIADVLNNPELMAELRGVSFSFGDKIEGQAVLISRVERAVPGILKSEKEACEAALVDALKEMRLHALQKGAHSVQGIKSTVTGAPYSSQSDYLCMTGHTNSRVHLEGNVVMEAAAAQVPLTPQTDNMDGSDPHVERQPQERPVSKPQIDPEQDAIYGTPWD